MSTKKNLAAAVVAVASALGLGASTVSATTAPRFRRVVGAAAPRGTFVSPPPRLHRTIHWFHSHASRRTLQGRAADYGRTVVVGLESNRDLKDLTAEYGWLQVSPIADLHAVEVDAGPKQLNRLLAGAPGDPRIRYVAPIGPKRSLLRLRNDPLVRMTNPAIDLPYEWQVAETRLDLALNLSQGSPSILACTVDTGVATVPDLAGKIVDRLYLNGLSNGVDQQGHGTAVATIIAATNDDGYGMLGFGGATRIVTFRDDALTDTSVAIGITTLTRLGCRIINLSLGGPDPITGILRDAIEKAVAAGVLLVAASGNDGADTVSHPAADLQPPNGAPSVGLAVGASDVFGAVSPFSNYGENLSLLAPGDYDYFSCSGVLAAIPAPSKMFDDTCYPSFTRAGGRYAYVGGTSFAAPEVVGVAALVWAVRPELRNFEVAEIIKRSATNAASGWNPGSGYGVLDAAAALELATGRSGADVLAVSDLRTKRSGGHATASGKITGGDGVAATDVKVTCTAAGRPAPVTFHNGTFGCRWQIHASLRNQALHGQVTATDPDTHTTVSQPLTLGHPRVP